MGDVLYRVDHQYEEEARQAKRGKQLAMDLFGAAPATSESEEELTSRLAKAIGELGAQRSVWNFGDLQDALAGGDWFGQILEKHVRAACRLLIEEGRISPESKIAESTALRFAKTTMVKSKTERS